MAFEDTLYVCEECNVVHAVQGSSPFECTVCDGTRFNELTKEDLFGD